MSTEIRLNREEADGKRQTVSALDRLSGSLRGVGGAKRPPIHLWNPAFCGDIDMRIAADGSWRYNGSPIGRLPLVKLFASILRREGDAYVLVTPVEKVGIQVEDAPFLAVEMERDGAGHDQVLVFRTNVDDLVTAGPRRPLRFELGPCDGLKPYLLVRDGLWARLARPLLYEICAIGVDEPSMGQGSFGVWSSGAFFAMAAIKEIQE